MRAQLVLVSVAMFYAAPAFAVGNDDVRAALEQRFKGDRTGACDKVVSLTLKQRGQVLQGERY